MEKNGMEMDIMKKVTLNLKSKMEKGSLKNMIIMVN